MEHALYFITGFCALIVFILGLKVAGLDNAIEEKINEALETLSDKFYWNVARPVRIAISNILYKVGDAVHHVAYKLDVDW